MIAHGSFRQEITQQGVQLLPRDQGLLKMWGVLWKSCKQVEGKACQQWHSYIMGYQGLYIPSSRIMLCRERAAARSLSIVLLLLMSGLAARSLISDPKLTSAGTSPVRLLSSAMT